MKTWTFGSDNDYLVFLVLEGKKRATTSLYKEYEMEKEELPKVGDMGVLLFSNGNKACITKVVNVIIKKFKEINEELSSLEGEGSLEHYRKVHYDIFSKIDNNFNEDSLVVFEIFEVVDKYER
jgi:uncharacterized protein YhfF